MRGFLISITAATLVAFSSIAAFAQNPERLDSAVVSSSRAGADTPVSYTMVGREEIRQVTPSSSIPMALALQPSVVTYNEGGTGLGNSSMTVRGVKGSQINVTLNGVTLNDAESQEVFWVNIPSLSNLVSSVQLQRGLGTSASGAGAFGASVNMNTAFVDSEPSVYFDASAGSFSTFTTTVSASTGLRPSGFYATAAYSRGYTDGYIRGGWVKSQSAFLTLGWMKGSNSARLVYLMGDQHSGITWDGISLEQFEKDPTYNGAGEYYDDLGNVYYYPNHSDNYRQHHLQLNYTHSFSDALVWSTTADYTRGDGYDEYYKVGKKLSNFGLESPYLASDGQSYKKSDMVYRKVMGNDSFTLNSDVRYRSGKLRATAGASLSRYIGEHYGKMLWVKVMGDDADFSSYNDNRTWYSNDGKKTDLSLFARAEWLLSPSLTLYADLQGRFIWYDFTGTDDDFWEGGDFTIDYTNRWNFLNPRAGLSYRLTPSDRFYGSVAFGHREPRRGDIKENVKGDVSPISPEKMLDFEAGYQRTGKVFSAGVNLYAMEYWDMLLETGRLSSSGYAIKENVPRGWRRGVEITAAYRPLPWLIVDANATVSTNRIKDYTAYVEVLDGETGQTQAISYGQTTMLMSPSLVSMLRTTFHPIEGMEISLDGKWVGRQFMDNTSRDEMAIPGYFVMNLSARHDFHVGGGILSLGAYVGNILNRNYYAYGWRWEGYSLSEDALYTDIGVYPQARRNFAARITYSF